MPYAEGRIFNDADSHIMETKDWLTSYADPKIRPRLAPLDLTMAGGKATDDLVTALSQSAEPTTILTKRRRSVSIPAITTNCSAHTPEGVGQIHGTA